MKLKDATRNLGSVRLIYFPLILFFLTAASSTFANTQVVLRTQAVNKMPTTVITYRAPATYRRSGNDLYDTRGKKYTAVRRTVVSNTNAGYVAVRNSNYNTNGTRYIAVRNADYGAPRYVAVRRSPSTFVDDNGTRYVAVSNAAPNMTRYAAVRSGYRTDNGIVGYVDVNNNLASAPIDDDVRYVPVRNYTPSTRYVAVRNVDVNDNDIVVAPSESVSTTRYVAVQSDDPDDTITLPDDEEATIAVPTESVSTTRYIPVQNASYEQTIAAPAATTSRTIVEYAPADYYNGSEDVALTDYPEVITTETASYVPASYYDNSEINDLAYLDGGGATFVANDNVDYASLRPATMSTVSYVPVVDVDESTTLPVRHEVVVDDETGTGSVSLMPVEKVESLNTQPVSYVPISNVNTIDATDVAYDAHPTMVSSVEAEPVITADNQTVVAEEGELSGTQQIAGSYGYRDGFADGRDAALEGDVYHPENSGDYQKATEGYEDTFGDKGVYKDSYRNSYLNGYRAGFDSISTGG